ncbi:4-chlorobenzoate--CoA ligase [Delftia tsuruhatensis]|uniref:AMP-binding protein n=1 Tax=Delftia tsuruhatensis TaxID=180282 RepID=UPI001E7ED233|nr:AMP-binding protein [Delftia tsuruhatensis]CAB5716002.1 4-chlorobenzoate--CoA ligase [Delftia tsuruhatensis]CAC9681289.1 4-chlorobenzoate--CoA ligase [Delftia tsuruhatensis]
MVESPSSHPLPHPLAAPLQHPWTLVHGPLEHWARERPEAIALQSEAGQWSFAALHEAVRQRSAALVSAQAPAMRMLDTGQGRSTLDAIVEFLAIIHSGRCAAVADPDWPEAVRQRIEGWLPDEPGTLAQAWPTAAFYTGFTSGSTGLPKGFMRHHQSWTESFRVCLQDFGCVAAQRTMAPGRLSHSLFLFGVMQGLWCGAGAVVQEKFSAARCLASLARGEAPCLVAVPSQLLLMLQWAAHRALEPITGVELIMISGARWMRAQTPALRALFPRARIIEFYGASEASFIAWMDADEQAPAQAVGRPFSNVQLEIRPASGQPGDPALAGGDGLIYMRSPMLFMDYVGEARDGTAALRDGDWLSVRDMGHIDAGGRLCLAGRQSRMLVTQGKNLFPEEVEALLAEHPGVTQVSLQGLPDTLRGMQVHVVVQWKESAPGGCAQALSAWLRERIEAYKLPRQWWTCADWPQTASGKTDHARLARALAATAAGQPLVDGPALWPLP